MKKISVFLAILALTLVLGLSAGFAQSTEVGKIFLPIVFNNYNPDAAVIEVTKTADPTEITVPGGEVTFFVTVENKSTSGSSVSIDSLVDDIHGDLDGQGSCAVPQTIFPGGTYTCQFTVEVLGEVGYHEIDTVTASGIDRLGNPVSDSDTARVQIAEVIQVTKTADPRDLTYPGGEVTFTILLENNGGPENVLTINSLVDDVHGDLNNKLDSTCSMPQEILPSESYTCEFTAIVTGEVGYREHDTVTASGVDAQDNPISDLDTAWVQIVDVIKVTKTANPHRVIEPGGNVTFTVLIENNAGPDNPVTITSLTDDIHGDLNGQGTCSVEQVIQPGESYECHFTAEVSGSAGDVEIDTVTASGTDSQGRPVSDSDSARVKFLKQCEATEAEGAIGYEDLPDDESNDFDYNDWNTDIFIQLDFVEEPRCGLQEIDFEITPQARGATFQHDFGMIIPADTFGSDGVATLTVVDLIGDTIFSSTTPFIASIDNNFHEVLFTSNALPGLSNTIEGQEPFLIPSQRYVTLTIVFDTPAPFSLEDYELTDPHGSGLFFDPYLHVHEWDGFIHQGDLNMLVIPEIDLPWAEERIRIDQAFPDVTFDPGPPININFPEDWWLNFNDCVYNGVTCPLTPAP